MKARRFYIDIQSRAFISNPSSDLAASTTAFTRSDFETIELYFVEKPNTFGYTFADYSANTVKVAIGNEGLPTSGTFKITDGVSTTPALAYSITAGGLKSALDALNSNAGIFSAGPCQVSGSLPEFVVTVGSDNAGDIDDLATDDNELVPATSISFIQRQSATATRPLVFNLVLQRAPAVLTTSFAAIPSTITTSVSVSVEGNANTAEQQRIEFSQIPAEGTYSLTFPSRSISPISVSGSRFIATQHGLYNGQLIALSGFSVTAGSGFSNTSYYVTNRTRDSFQIASLAEGTAITASSGVGTGSAILSDITTSPIPYNANAGLIEAIIAATGLNNGGVPQIIVNGVTGTYFILTFANESFGINFPLTQVVSSTLKAANGLTGTLDLNTVGVRDLIRNEENDNLTFEVEVTASGSSTQTYKTTASIDRDIITQTTQPIVPASTFSANYMRVETGITGLTGGGATKLDGLVTVNGTYPVGICVFLLIGGVPQIWQLTSGATAEDASNGIVRPDDYATSTNQKVWLQRM